MNLPNLLTLCRFALIPVYILLFYLDYKILALFVFLLAGATDLLDGYLARRYGQVTELGVMLDPLADKLMMITVIISLLISHMISFPAAMLIFVRDAGMIVGSAIFHFRGKKTVPANILGKLTTALFYLALLLVFFEVGFAHLLLWIVIAFSFITFFVYLLQFKSINKSLV